MNVGMRTMTAVLCAATPMAFVACGGGDSGEEATTSEVRPSVETESSQLSTSSPSVADAASSEPATVVASSSAIVGDGFTISGTLESSQGGLSVVASGAEFLMLSPAVDGVRIDRSDDGISWTSVASNFAALYVGKVASDAERVIATGSTEAIDALTVWESSDGGADWAALPPVPVVEAEGEYIIPSTYPTGLAVAGERIVVLAQEPLNFDWRAYSVGELGQDHGQMTGMSSGGGQGETVTVEFEDGYQLIVDPSEVGLEVGNLMSGQDLVAYSFDGSSWTRTALPWEQGLANNVVHGPGGFAALAGQNDHTRLMLSDDGITWSEHTPPEGFGSEFSLGGGPLGYVMAGAGQIAFSADGDTWENVHDYTDLDPMVSGSMLDAGGPAGFTFAEPSYTAGVPARLFWSSDGRSWTETEFAVTDTSGGLAAAVNDRMGLLVPYTVGFGMPPALPDDPDELKAAVAATFIQGPSDSSDLRTFFPPITDDEAACIAADLVDRMGEDRVRELPFGYGSFHVLGWGMVASLDEDDAETVVDVLASCTPSWEFLLMLGATSGTDLISEETARCIQDDLPDDVAREIFALELYRPYDDPGWTEGLNHLQPLVDAFERCATEQELNALDWD